MHRSILTGVVALALAGTPALPVKPAEANTAKLIGGIVALISKALRSKKPIPRTMPVKPPVVAKPTVSPTPAIPRGALAATPVARATVVPLGTATGLAISRQLQTITDIASKINVGKAALNFGGSVIAYTAIDFVVQKAALAFSGDPVADHAVRTEIGATKFGGLQEYHPRVCGRPDGSTYVVPQWVETCYNNKPVGTLETPLDLSGLETQG